MKAHKKAVEAIRKFSKNKAKIGIALATAVSIPKTNSDEDIEKAYRKTFEGSGTFYNAWYSEPLVGNRPVALNEKEQIKESDLKDVYSPLDFIGINYYGPSQDEEYTPKQVIGGIQGWVDCFDKANFKAHLFVGGVSDPSDIKGNPGLLKAFEMGKRV